MTLSASGFSLPRKVLFISGIGGNTQRYRCHHAQEQLALHDISSQLRLHTDHAILADALNTDICILHRVPYSDLVKDLIDLLHSQGKIAIYDTDDLVFDPGIVDQIRLLDVLSPAEAHRHREDVPRNRQTMLACDHVLVPTDYLARVVAALGQRASVHRNALNAEFVRLAQDAYEQNLARRRGVDATVIIGYASGTLSHDWDFLEAADALLYLLETYDHVALHIFGHLHLDDRFSPWAHRIQRTPFLPWQQVPAVVGRFDVNLSPLEQDNPFCQGKSELKYFTAGVVGVPTIASRTDAFEYAIQHGENGFLASDTAEWLAALELLITDSEIRHVVGERARAHALRNYAPAVRARSLISLLSDIWQQQSALVSGTKPREKAELQADVIQLQQKHLIRQRKVVMEMTRQVETQRDQLSRYEVQIADLEHEVADLRRVWASQLETTVAAYRRRPMAQAVARGKIMIKKWLRLSPKVEVDGRSASPGPELVAGCSQGQTFFAAKDGLRCLEILFATFGRVNTGQVVFHLCSSVTSTEDMTTVQVNAAALKDNRYHHFDFEPLGDSAGRSYYFYLESPTAVPGDAVSVWVFEETASKNKTRYVGQNPTDGQIAFLARYLDNDEGEAV